MAELTGRELDAAVARLMGWKYQQRAPKGQFCRSVGNDQGWWQQPGVDGWACAPCSDLPPHYSSDVAAAFQVVDHLQEQGIYLVLDSHPEDGWTATFDRCITRIERLWRRAGQGRGATPAEAICRAALEVNRDGTGQSFGSLAISIVSLFLEMIRDA